MLGSILLTGLSWIPLQQDETVRDFKKYFRRAKETWERVEYVQALRGIDEPEVLRLLLPVASDEDGAVAAAAIEVLSNLSSGKSREGIRPLLEKGKPLKEMPVLLQIIAQGRWSEYADLTRTYLESKHDGARLWAVVGAGAFPDLDAMDGLIEIARNEKVSSIRVAAVDGLAVLGLGREEKVGGALVEAFLDGDLMVQTAACRALRVVRVKEAIGPLIECLSNGEGRILQEIYPTLIEITDLQFTDDPGVWQRWWERAEEAYVVPSELEIEARRAARQKTNELYVPSKAAGNFAGVPSPSHRQIFVIDVSGSMEEFVVDREKFLADGFTRFEKIEIVRKQVMAAIDSLDSSVKFNILSFATEIEPWRKKLAPANALNKKSAKEFVRKLKPLGGAAAAAAASVGLTGSAGLNQGRTNSYGALCAALGVPPLAMAGRAVTAADSVKSEVDTIYFLSDGIPSVGALVDTDDILKAIREWNRFRRVTIHTLAIGEFQKDFMGKLASQNGGKFADLGH
ncbi:MAG: hypothetical protein MK213_10520 [Planctomycetes bacterium]|nr:hypothetical protein [Planctomycetota bacterium]